MGLPFDSADARSKKGPGAARRKSNDELKLELLNQYGATFRWILAALLALNGGALFVLWNGRDVPIAEMASSMFFAFGLLLAIFAAIFALTRYSEQFRYYSGTSDVPEFWEKWEMNPPKTLKANLAFVGALLSLPEFLMSISMVAFLGGGVSLTQVRADREIQGLERKAREIEAKTEARGRELKRLEAELTALEKRK